MILIAPIHLKENLFLCVHHKYLYLILLQGSRLLIKCTVLKLVICEDSLMNILCSLLLL
jgi:hypothetical protein